MLKPVGRRSCSGEWKKPDDMPQILYELLRLRGIGDAETAHAFLNPDISRLTDPFLLNDMQRAVEVIQKALAAGERICVWGDYDVDGVCASAILVSYLKSVGGNADAYLPSRHAEGYGLNEAAIRTISETHDLLITVDCGITAVELIDLANSLGLKTIVTDHHRPENELPHCPTVNPLLNEYPFPYLCGAGVAFKLVCALAGLEGAMEYIDYAALATIADIVPLNGENRIIARAGLKRINLAPRAGVLALIESSGLGGRAISAGNVAFQLTPRLNAGGRIGSAMRAYDLLTCVNREKCAALAEELNSENAYRKTLEQQVLKDAEKMLADFDFPKHRAIIIVGEGWNPGVIGLAASRLTEKYHYPSIVLTEENGVCTGSCRSTDEIDIHAALSSVSEHLIQFGGHKMAAGLKIKTDKIEDFRNALDNYLRSEIPDEAYIPKIEYDLRVTPTDLTFENVNALNELAPLGCGNPAPLFIMECDIRNARRVGVDGAHLKLNLKCDSDAIDGIWFRNGDRLSGLPTRAECMFSPSVGEFQGRRYVQAEMREILPAAPEACLITEETRAERMFQSFLTQHVYNRTHIASEGISISAEKLGEMLSGGCQGTLIITASPESANAVIKALNGNVNIDVFSGTYPTDARCFNALCVAPVGAVPSGYSKKIAAGIPAWLVDADCELENMPPCKMLSMLPDVDVLRGAYSRIRAISRTRSGFESRDSLISACLNGIDAAYTSFAASLSVLEELELVNITDTNTRIRLEVPPTVKRDPAESRMFSMMQQLRDFYIGKGGKSI